MKHERKGMAYIIQAIKERISYDFLIKIKEKYSIDQFLVFIFTASIFAPFYVSVIFVSCISIMTMINYQKRIQAFSAPYTKLLFSFLIIAFFVAAVYNNYTGMMYTIMIYAIFTSAFYIRSVMTRTLFHQCMDLVCIESIWCLMVALYQKASAFALAPNYRPVSVFTNANYYGMIIEFVILIAVYRIFTNPNLSVFYMAVIGLNLIGLYLTASFSSMLTAFCSVMIFMLLKKKYRICAFLMAGAVFCVVLTAMFPAIMPRGSEAIDHTLAQRISIWITSIRGIRQHPFLGRGAMAYQLVYENFAGYKTFHCHNLLLDILLNFGLFGLACIGIYFLMQLKILLVRIHKNICSNMNLLLIAAISAVLIHGLTDVTIMWIQTSALFLLIYSSTGIGSTELARKIRIPALLPEYSGTSALKLTKDFGK